jgi:hypothetical protein
MTWYCKNLGNGTQAFPITCKIQDAFIIEYGRAQFPPGMAVFSSATSGAAQVTAYFSPAAEELALMFGASPCEKPDKHSLSIMCGDENNCWSANF